MLATLITWTSFFLVSTVKGQSCMVCPTNALEANLVPARVVLANSVEARFELIMRVLKNSFPDIDDLDNLKSDDRKLYLDYWASRTPNERLREVMRLNRCKWGDEVFDRGMDKTRIEVYHLGEEEPYLIFTRKSDAPDEPWIRTELRPQIPSE